MSDFNGFNHDTIAFFQELALNNSKAWFDENRQRYEKSVKQPSMDFVGEMGEMFHMLVPDIHAIPKVNKSLFRVNRDTRFSKDKRPYKTNMGIWFWEGERKRMECSGFYFHLEPDKLMLGTGMYRFPDFALKEFRNRMNNEKAASDLIESVKSVEKEGYIIGTSHYKRVPKGFEPGHPMKDFLLFNGFTAHREYDIPDSFFNVSILDFCFQHFKKMFPIHNWLKTYIG